MSKMLKTSADNRKCMYPNCTRTQSIYNHKTYCHVHLMQVPPEQKRRILAPQQANV
jgi:hypothetical protein